MMECLQSFVLIHCSTWAQHPMALKIWPYIFLRRSLPRVGLHLGVPAQYSRAHWYGRGPHECYPDRQYGAFLRQYSVEDIKEFHVPYIFPSACQMPKYHCPERWPPYSRLISTAGRCFLLTPGSVVCCKPSLKQRHRAGENGGRSDTRWVTLSDENGAGIAAVALTKPMQVNATRSVDIFYLWRVVAPNSVQRKHARDGD